MFAKDKKKNTPLCVYRLGTHTFFGLAILAYPSQSFRICCCVLKPDVPIDFSWCNNVLKDVRNIQLGDGFKHFICSPLFGEDSHFDLYFSGGLKPPTSQDIFWCL